jgi:2-succinyl-5-enolpyruvyl-6-hydroxy-3-cyclohexene-1-carboxylate synthase
VKDTGLREEYRNRWAAANRRSWLAVEQELARPSTALSEPCAVRVVLDLLPHDCLLMLGNSLPIREVDAYVPIGRRQLRVLAQRGANGIDGLIAGAAGAASVHAQATVLLLGDVSFMHDLGGLAAAREAQGPLAIIVIDNGGGRIFEQLPIFDQLRGHAELERFWLTPPRADLAHAAGLFGYGYVRVSEQERIAEAISVATCEPGVHVVHIVVDSGSARAAEHRILRALQRVGELSE